MEAVQMVLEMSVVGTDDAGNEGQTLHLSLWWFSRSHY